MADRYWVGGTSTWDGTAGTKWATTSGGAGGAAVPTAVDDVFLNAASGAVTVTVSGSVPARSLDCNGFTGTLTDVTGATVNIGTSTVPASNIALRLAAGMTLTIVGTFTFIFPGTNTTPQTITTAGKTMPGMTFSGSTGSWQFADNVTATGATITYSSASTAVLDFNGKTFNFATFTGNTGTTKTLTLGAAQITMTGSWLFRGTVTANTATITQTGLTLGFDNSGSAGANYGGLSLIQTGSGVYALGAPTNSAGVFVTLANYTRTGTAVKTDGVSIAFNGVTITGTLTLGGNTTQGVNRLLVQGGTLGTQSVITATGAAVVISGDVTFMDMEISGSPSWTNTGSKYVGDALGNGTFIVSKRTAPSTRYKIAGGAFSTANVWAASSGAATDNRVPLEQDDIVLDSNSGAGTHTSDMPRTGANFTEVSGFVGTLSQSATTIYGSLTLVSGSTLSGSGSQVLAGRGTHTINLGGKSSNAAYTVTAPGGTYTLAADWFSTAAFTHNFGGLDFAGFNVTFDSFSGTSPNVRSLTLGTGTITTRVTGSSTFWNMGVTTGLTFSGASSTIVLGLATVNARTFAGGGLSYGALRYTVADSPGALLITGANTFGTLEVGPEHRVSLPASTTQVVTTPTLTGRFNGYHRMTGVASTGTVSVPDSAALSALTDLDIRVRCSLDDWTPAVVSVMLAKSGTGATSTEYEFRVATTGLLTLVIGDTSSVTGVSSSVAPTVTDGVAYWIRVTRRASDGRVQFFQAPDNTSMPSSWTQVGTNATNSRVMSDQTNPVVFGAAAAAANNSNLIPMAGKFYQAQIRNNVLDDGTGIQLDADFTQASTFGVNSFTESSSNAATVTIFDLAQMGDGRVHVISSIGGTPAVLTKPFTDPYGNVATVVGTHITQNSDSITFSSAASSADTPYIPDSPAISFTSSSDFDLRALVALDDWTPATVQYLISKEGGAGASFYEYRFYMDTTGKLTLRMGNGVASNATTLSSVVTGFTDGTKNWVRVTKRGSDGQVKFWTASGAIANPVTADWAQLGTNLTNVQGWDGTGPVMFGNTGTTVGLGTGSAFSGKHYRGQIRNNILDDGTGIVADVSFAPTTTVSEDYMRLVDNTALGATFYAGSHSVDGTGNSGWSFTNAPATGTTADDMFLVMA
jgi:hypothetical protein